VLFRSSFLNQFLPELYPPVALADELIPPAAMALSCHPNPFSSSLDLDFTLGRELTPLSLDVYNLRGQKVRNILSGSQAKGSHRAAWDGRDDQGRKVSAGLYIIELRAPQERKSVKAVLLK